MRSLICWMAALGAAAAVCLPAQAAPRAGAGAAGVRIERIAYHGWDGAWRMTNGAVDLVFVAQIGRIMRYGFAGGPNLLWENPALRGKTVDPATAAEWANFGGDKLWIAPQDRWRGEQDPYLDAGACKVTVLPGQQLRIAGPVSPNYGVRFVRVIAMAARGTQVTLRNTLLNAGSETVEWAVWEVAQVGDPDFATLPLAVAPRFPLGYRELAIAPVGATTRYTDRLELRRDRRTPYKIGAASPQGFVSMRKGAVTMVVEAELERRAAYPDNGCAQEIYSNPDPYRYMELEMLGPMRHLPPGGQSELVTRWRIDRL